MSQTLTGGEIVAEVLLREQVPYMVGIPGHGCLPLVDAVVSRQPRLRVLQVMHEQSSVHLADAYYRVSGRPLACFTSIGPGATNTTIGMAQAYVDSTAVLLLSGDVHTHMRGHGVLQEPERRHSADLPRILEPVVKRWWQPDRTEQLPFVMRRAFDTMLGGRPGPVLVSLPMDVQADSAEVELEHTPHQRHQRSRPDAQAVERAAALLASARRPLLLAGGGVIAADASPALLALAEHLGAPVVTSFNGKGSVPEDHRLFGYYTGALGSTAGNALAREADVVLAVGCRFADWTTSSYRPGITWSIPPTRLIQLDIDPLEVGKNYPVQEALVGDARAGLEDLLAALRALRPEAADLDASPYVAELARLRDEWQEVLSGPRTSDALPMTISRALVTLRAELERDAIVVTGAGNPQSQVFQEFDVYGARTHISSGGFSTMGFTVPGAIGAKLARPDRQVVGVAGDGDYMQTMQELATAVMYRIPIVILLLNNSGWHSIRSLQWNDYGQERVLATRFLRDKPGGWGDGGAQGEPYTPDFAASARAFGAWAQRVEDPAELAPALRQALAQDGPAVVEVITSQNFPLSGITKTGWWDVPVPAYLKERRAAYDLGRREERLV